MAASGGFEPPECQSQSLMPYHLATRQLNKKKWWRVMDLNHGTRRNRFTVCRVWPLRYPSKKKWCRLRESNPQPTDSYYYSFHYQFLVCSLDFLLAISIDLGPSYKVSTLGINLARDCHISYIVFFLFYHVLYLLLYKLQLKSDNLDIKELNWILNY